MEAYRLPWGRRNESRSATRHPFPPEPRAAVKRMVPVRRFHQRWRSTSDLAKLCLVIGAALLMIALLGAVVNLVMGSLFQSTGMAMVGLFHLVLGVCNWPPRGITALGAADALSECESTLDA